MARPTTNTLTKAEQRIMQVLWQKGEANVREITNALSDKYGLAYTTVLTTTRILVDKNYVKFRKQGRSHVYSPLISKQVARTGMISSVLGGLFEGSPRLLAQHLIETNDLSAQDLRELRALLAEKSGDKHNDQN